MNALVVLVGGIPTSKLEYVSNAEVKAYTEVKTNPEKLKAAKAKQDAKGKKSTLNERLKGFKDLTT